MAAKTPTIIEDEVYGQTFSGFQLLVFGLTSVSDSDTIDLSDYGAVPQKVGWEGDAGSDHCAPILSGTTVTLNTGGGTPTGNLYVWYGGGDNQE